VSKFPLNLLVEILKLLLKYQKSLKFIYIYIYIYIEFPLWIRPSWLSFTASARLLCKSSFPSSARLAHARLWRILQNTISSLIRTFHPRRLLSLPSLTHGPYLALADPSHAAAESRHVRPPCTTQLRASSGRLHALTRPAIKALLNPSYHRPVFNGVKAIDAACYQLGHPSLVLPRPL
jgi:hypothetical protein